MHYLDSLDIWKKKEWSDLFCEYTQFLFLTANNVKNMYLFFFNIVCSMKKVQ